MQAVAEELGDQAKQVDVLLSLAHLYHVTETTKAQETLVQALKLAQEVGDKGQEGRALYLLATHAQSQYNLSASRKYCEASIEKYQQAGQTAEMARSISFLAVLLGFLGEHASALEAAQRSVEISKSKGDNLLEASSLRRLAITYLNQYQDADALPIAVEALQAVQKVGDLLDEVHAFNVLGIIQGRLGMVEDAETTFLKGLQLAESIGNEVGIQWILNNISGYAYCWHLGEYTKNLHLIEDLEEKARLENNKSLKINLVLVKAFELIRLGQYAQTLELCDFVMTLHSVVGDQIYAFNLGLTALMFAELDQLDQSYIYLDKQRKFCDQTQSPSQRAANEYSTAQVALIDSDVGKLMPGLEAIDRSIRYYRGLKNDVEVADALNLKAQLHLALLGEDQSHAGVALECTTEAIECYQRDVSSWVMPEQIYFHHSQALRANGMEMEADEYLSKAFDRMMKVAGNIDDKELRRSYLENVRDNRNLHAAYQERFGDKEG